ncbi:MAG: nucleotidyltransferase substrate binding protein [Candidatus Kapaibacterium sp.]
MNPDTRWKQRFQNYSRALKLLREAIADRENLSELEKEGTVQRFEFTLELAWKTLKDYLEESGVIVTPITPMSVIKEAFAAEIIRDGPLWIDMLKTRNEMSHTYEEAAFEEAVQKIADRYLKGLEELYEFFQHKGSHE